MQCMSTDVAKYLHGFHKRKEGKQDQERVGHRILKIKEERNLQDGVWKKDKNDFGNQKLSDIIKLNIETSYFHRSVTSNLGNLLT